MAPTLRMMRLVPTRRLLDRVTLWTEVLEDRCVLTTADVAIGNAFELPNLEPGTVNPNAVVVQFHPAAKQIEYALPALAGATITPISMQQPAWMKVTLPDGTSAMTALAVLQAHPLVATAAFDYLVNVAAVPNDPRFSEQWGLHNIGQTGGTADVDIDAPEAWDLISSTPVVVAVIDTGVDHQHEDLRDNMWRNTGEIPGNGIDDDGNGFVDDVFGYDFANNDGDPMDDFGHGTHVAGILGAKGNNALGVAGVNWNVRIMALKFITANGTGSLADAARALDYAVTMGAKVSNNSYAGGGFLQAMLDAIVRGRSVGHVFVAAAGNGGSDQRGDNNDIIPTYPANFASDNVLAVAATDHNDQLASFSNYGNNTVHLAAPGVNILSTVPNHGYSAFSGTSMAAPHVAGAVALAMARHTKFTYRQVIDHLLATTNPVASLTDKTVTGGRLNLNGAVSDPPPDTTGPRAEVARPNGYVSGQISRAKLSFNESMRPSTFTAADVTMTGPRGPISITNVKSADPNGRDFEIHFPTQWLQGTYTVRVGPDIRDLAGNLMDQDRDGIPGEPVDDQFVFSFTISREIRFTSNDSGPIQDFAVSISELVIDQDIPIGDLDVQIDISHTLTTDLSVLLIAPGGSDGVILASGRGAGADFQNTIFDDEASTSIVHGQAPFAGSYQPEEALSFLDGRSTQGTWQLWIFDLGAGNQGRLNSWSLIVQPGGTTGRIKTFGAPGENDTTGKAPLPSASFDAFHVARSQRAQAKAPMDEPPSVRIGDRLATTLPLGLLAPEARIWERASATLPAIPWLPADARDWGAGENGVAVASFIDGSALTVDVTEPRRPVRAPLADWGTRLDGLDDLFERWPAEG